MSAPWTKGSIRPVRILSTCGPTILAVCTLFSGVDVGTVKAGYQRSEERCVVRGVLLPGDKEVVIKEFPDPKPGPGQVVVRMKASGICGSELHGRYQPSKEHIAERGMADKIGGHEPAGVVEAVGEGVVNVQPGDRVMVYHIMGCGYCKYCLSGWMINCATTWKSHGWTAHGGHADFLLTDARNCVKMPDRLSFIDGAICACAGGTAYQATKRLGVSGLDTVALFGLGPVGLCGLLIAKGMGARVIGVDVIPERLELASKLGADVVIDGSRMDPVAAIRDLTHGEGASVAIDYSASPAARNQTLDCCRVWGRVAWVGEGNKTTIEPSPQMLHKQLTVIGSWVCGLWELRELGEFLADHSISLERIVTHRFPLEQTDEALRLFDSGRTGKVVVVWP